PCPYFPPTSNTVSYGISCSTGFLKANGDGIFYVPADVFQVSIEVFGDEAGGSTDSETMNVLPGGILFIVFSGADVFVTEVPPSQPIADRLAQAIVRTSGPNGKIIFKYDCNTVSPCATQLDNGSQYIDSEGFTVLRFDY